MNLEGTENVDVLVIGAGPSGSVAASILRNHGYQIKIVEKQTFPRFVIGESLLPRCMDNLQEAGLLAAVEKGGFQKKFGAKFVRNIDTCDFDFSAQFTKGWSWTWQVQRADFDHLLAQETANKGVDIEYNAEVTAVKFHQDGSSETTVKRGDGSLLNIHAKRIVDASGYGRVLPRLLDLDIPSDFPMRASFFCHLQDPRRPTDGNRITIIYFTKEVWLWVIPFSDGITSVGVTGSPEQINQFEGALGEQYQQWMDTVPHLKGRFSIHDQVFTPRKITGYSSAVKQLYGLGYVLTGNSTEFLDPIFSSGVTLATESGATAARLIARELEGEKVNWESEYSDYIKGGVNVFRTFVQCWYEGLLPKIIFSNESNAEIKQQICSVLAGYVWDTRNPFVRKHERAVRALAGVIRSC
ncbi:NAD(P)/FAD-dependent oxidoreductase [Catalinimonas niigatensis]|uniref:NAD(P)/FAD-dependent oxidoreductase n=1 Tax=Catalinimonas niigatensis TaxID=1397264 RepID=UPI002666FE53|nr:NAD(P)/FAD-dependent oxidoreductase [Catalinimonas niigatensis]WPP48754.1 NAD(P)/FAD-dependent oxidoreductase [Catalinimonas niigatensis]